MKKKFMIDEFKPDVVLAFLHPESKGAEMTVEYARSQNIPVKEF